MKWVGAVVAGAALFSCIGPGTATRSPDSSGDTWAELRSAHFTLVSDLSEPEATAVIGGFEETYDLLGRALFRGQAVPRYRTTAVVFRSDHDLKEFVGEGFGGVYYATLPNDLEPSPTLLASGTLSPFARLVFTHELTHRFNHVALGPAPTWLHEGLADYYATIRDGADGPIVGEIDPRYTCTPDGLGDLICYRYDRLSGARLPTARQIVTMGRAEFYGTDTLESGNATWEQKRKRSAHYALAWLLVHLLMHGDQPYAREFREVMKTPPSTQKGAALSAVVERVPSGRLDADLKAYLQHAIPWRQHHARLPAASDVQRRPLNGTEVLLWWARLDSFQGKFADRARSRLQEAAERGSVEHPGAPSFWLGRFEQLHERHGDAERAYQAALKLEPDNPDYLYGLLGVYWSTQSGMTWSEAAASPRVGELVQALARSARTPWQLSAVAAHRLYSRDLEGALSVSRRACDLGPDCWSCFHNYAAALYAAGQAREALQAEETALGRLPEGAAPKVAALLQSSTRFYADALSGPNAVEGKDPPILLAP